MRQGHCGPHSYRAGNKGSKASSPLSVPSTVIEEQLGAFRAELRRSLEKPLARALREAGACAFGAEERTLPWAGGEL